MQGQGASTKPPELSRFVGDLVCNPVAVTLAVVLIANDHWAKSTFHNALTGKVSDVAGLALFPLVVVALIEAVRWLFIRPRWPLSPRSLLVVILFTGVLFAGSKLWEPAGALYRGAYAVAQWPLLVPGSIAKGDGLPALGSIVLTKDPTDIFAVVALLLSWAIGRRAMARPGPLEESESASA